MRLCSARANTAIAPLRYNEPHVMAIKHYLYCCIAILLLLLQCIAKSRHGAGTPLTLQHTTCKGQGQTPVPQQTSESAQSTMGRVFSPLDNNGQQPRVSGRSIMLIMPVNTCRGSWRCTRSAVTIPHILR